MRKILALIVILLVLVVYCDEGIYTDPIEGVIWIGVYQQQKIEKYNVSTGERLLSINLPDKLTDFEVDENSGNVWVSMGLVDGNLVKYSNNGEELNNLILQDSPIRAVSVNKNTGNCWIITLTADVIKVSGSDFSILGQYNDGGYLRDISVNPSDDSCWIADYTGDRVFKLSTNMEKVAEFDTDLDTPLVISCYHNDGSCWIANWGGDEVVKIDSSGNELFRINVLEAEQVCVDQNDGCCYACNGLFNYLYYFSESGEKLGTTFIDGIEYRDLDVNTYDDTLWVSMDWEDYIYKLSKDLSEELLRVEYQDGALLSVKDGSKN